jgi:hypothetical protein
MKLLKREKGVREESLGLEENRIKNLIPTLKHNVLKFGREIHYSGVYTNLWLWNVIFSNAAISTILYVIVHKNYNLIPSKIGLNLDTVKGYDYIVSKQILYAPIAVHIVISILTFIFVFRQGKKSNHLLILLLLNVFVLSFFEVKGVSYLVEYFK